MKIGSERGGVKLQIKLLKSKIEELGGGDRKNWKVCEINHTDYIVAEEWSCDFGYISSEAEISEFNDDSFSSIDSLTVNDSDNVAEEYWCDFGDISNEADMSEFNDDSLSSIDSLTVNDSVYVANFGNFK